MKLVRALRRGWLKLKKDGEDEEQEAPVYLLWADDGRVADKTAAGLTYIPPPKPPLPGHEESYHPPPEFLPTAVRIPLSPLSVRYKSSFPLFLQGINHPSPLSVRYKSQPTLSVRYKSLSPCFCEVQIALPFFL